MKHITTFALSTVAGHQDTHLSRTHILLKPKRFLAWPAVLHAGQCRSSSNRSGSHQALIQLQELLREKVDLLLISLPRDIQIFHVTLPLFVELLRITVSNTIQQQHNKSISKERASIKSAAQGQHDYTLLTLQHRSAIASSDPSGWRSLLACRLELLPCTETASAPERSLTAKS